MTSVIPIDPANAKTTKLTTKMKKFVNEKKFEAKSKKKTYADFVIKHYFVDSNGNKRKKNKIRLFFTQ